MLVFSAESVSPSPNHAPAIIYIDAQKGVSITYMNAESAKKELTKLVDPEKAVFLPRFFKTGPGEYGEGDKFIGVTVPNQRVVAEKFKTLSLNEIQKLLASPIHEHRLTALIILTIQYPKSDEKDQKAIYEFYLKNARAGHVNNWDLVDTSAHKIVGAHLLKSDRSNLKSLYNSNSLWLERIAVITTFAFINVDDYSDSLMLAEHFLHHEHDLMHKAVGWMLREIGKRDEKPLRDFLDQHAHEMPRTMLRYSIERLPEQDRKAYMAA